jgi:hypothetical protein
LMVRNKFIYGSFTVGYGLERFGSETLFYACGSCILL